MLSVRLGLAVCSHLFQALNFNPICDVWVFILSSQPGLHQNGSLWGNSVVGLISEVSENVSFRPLTCASRRVKVGIKSCPLWGGVILSKWGFP